MTVECALMKTSQLSILATCDGRNFGLTNLIFYDRITRKKLITKRLSSDWIILIKKRYIMSNPDIYWSKLWYHYLCRLGKHYLTTGRKDAFWYLQTETRGNSCALAASDAQIVATPMLAWWFVSTSPPVPPHPLSLLHTKIGQITLPTSLWVCVRVCVCVWMCSFCTLKWVVVDCTDLLHGKKPCLL